jgi:hypothetical protein
MSEMPHVVSGRLDAEHELRIFQPEFGDHLAEDLATRLAGIPRDIEQENRDRGAVRINQLGCKLASKKPGLPYPLGIPLDERIIVDAKRPLWEWPVNLNSVASVNPRFVAGAGTRGVQWSVSCRRTRRWAGLRGITARTAHSPNPSKALFSRSTPMKGSTRMTSLVWHLTWAILTFARRGGRPAVLFHK